MATVLCVNGKKGGNRKATDGDSKILIPELFWSLGRVNQMVNGLHEILVLFGHVSVS